MVDSLPPPFDSVVRPPAGHNGAAPGILVLLEGVAVSHSHHRRHHNHHHDPIVSGEVSERSSHDADENEFDG